MTDPVPHDGFADAASTLRSHAATVRTPEEREALLASAECFDDVRLKAVSAFAEASAAVEHAEALVAGQRRAQRHRLVVLGLALLVLVALGVVAALRY
jgi:hypothetical protein